MRSKALKIAKDKYFDSGFSDHMLLDIALGMYDDMMKEPEEAVSEEALTCFCAGNSFGVKKYEPLEINLDVAKKFIAQKYPYLSPYKDSKSTYTISDEKIATFEKKVTTIQAEGFDAGRLRNEYLMELIKGNTHEQAIKNLSQKWSIRTPKAKKKAPKKSD